MSTTSSTLDANGSRSSTNVPRSGLNLATTPSRPSTSSNQDLNLSLNTSPSSYISVSNVGTTGGLQKNEANLDYQTQAELQSHYVQHQSPTQQQQQQQQQSQYCRLGTGGIIGATTPTSLPPSVSLQERSSIIVPVTTHDVDPFVVTVRNSPNKLGKSSSSSFISKTANSVNCGSSKTGPRLALYRSNSSLDLLDRENYYLHQRASLGGAKLTSHHVHPHQHLQQVDRHSFQPQSGKAQSSKAETNYTGCFTRRKDFGSHGSIDVLANAGGGSNSAGNNSSGGSATVPSTATASSKNERSSSLGNTSTGHFLSLVASTMSRDRRGSFDVQDDTVSGQRDSASGGKSSGGKTGSNSTEPAGTRDTASPRLRLKFQKLWEHKEKSTLTQSSISSGSMSGGAQTDGSNNSTGSGKGSISTNTSKAEASIFRKLRGGSSTTSRNNGNTKSLPEGVKFDVLSSVNLTGGGDVTENNQGNEKPVLRNGASLMEERYRRRVFAHFDCQSVSANISYAARLRCLLSKRRNTTTGASAASRDRPISTPPSASLNNIAGAPGAQLSLTNSSDNASLDLVPADDSDLGDGNSNNLILSCPYFRNEIGGEEERLVCLTRFKSTKPASVLRSNYLHLTSSGSNIGHHGGSLDSASMSLGRGATVGNGNRIMNYNSLDGAFHRPHQARGLSILEWSPGTTHWVHGTCPYTKSSSRQTALEAVDLGAAYYRKYFYRQDHENWFGSDEDFGPLAISIKRERVESSAGSGGTISHKDNLSGSTVRYIYRLIVRSTELNTLRGAILEESIPGIKPNSNKGGCHAKDVIEFLLPEIQLSCLKLGLQSPGTEDQLLKLDQQILTHRHKVGIMYCKAGQATEEEMYNNEVAGPAFDEFLDLIGQRVRLKGFDKYTGGLDTKDDSTGLYTIYSQYQDCDVIFHVSTLLPFTANNRQQLMRKRHIGNDIVTIVFQEPGALPFTPKNIRSQFQHVFIVVRAINPCTENACYSVSVSRSKEVPLFGPPIPEGAKFLKNKEFVDFLLAKVINAENATYRSEKFTTMATRTRQEYLKDLVSSYSSNTSIDPRPKFSMLPFGNKKKDMGKPKFTADPVLRGALSWSVYLDDNSSETRLDTYVAISTDSIVIIDAVSREPVFAIPCTSILGWSTSMCNTLRIYYHQGECVTLHSKEPANVGENDDLVEIVSRLEAVTRGCETQEFVLRRNDLGQLGFHVQQDGVVTEVEICGFAAKAGLKQGSRLVEICKVAVATLNQEQMIDFLKTSNPVIIMVVPPLQDGSPRRGCDAKHCIYTLDFEAGYENLNLNGSTDDEPPSLIHHQFKAPTPNSLVQQAVPGNNRKRYEPRSFSPPRSSNSSGYGTGSSSKSFSSASDPHFPPNPHEGETLTSSSSGMSSTDDRWYDLSENLDGTNGSSNNSPPPIPARNVNTTSSIIVSPQSVVANQLVRPNSGTNISNASTVSNNNNNIVSKGNGAVRTATLHNNHPPFQNGTSVVVVNKQSVNPNNLVVSNNNNTTCINGNGTSNANNGIYMSSPTTPAVNPLDKSFSAKRDFFQRSNPHHGSFHTKLSPSRSHDLLHLKSTYGIHHSQLKPFPNNSVAGFEEYGALVTSSPNGRLQHRDDGRIFYENPGVAMFNNSPLIENTVKGKVTYLTDFPLAHSHSSEHLVSYATHESPSQKDMNALKNERLAMLKSTYLEKHRERYDRDNESNKSRFSAPADSISGELNHSEDDLSIVSNGQPRSASMTGRIPTSASPKIPNPNVDVKMRQLVNNGTPRQSSNRNSTLQEDLMRLIAPDLIPPQNIDVLASPATAVITNGQRPSSSGSVPITNGYVNLKTRPVSCGGEPGNGSSVYSSPARNALANANLTPRNTQVINGHNHLASHGNPGLSTPRRPVEKDDGKIKAVPLPLLPDSGEVDWSTLVDTATKAFQCCDIDVVVNGNSLSGASTTAATPPLKLNQSTNSPVLLTSPLPLNVSGLAATSLVGNGYPRSGSNISSCSSSSPQSILPWIDDMKPEENGEKLPGAPLESVFNLEARVSQLEAELRKEQQSKQVLAAKVANLQHENKVLQEQSTTTQNQFKRFAEWLRNTGVPSEQNQTGTKNSKTFETNERI